MLLTYLPPAVLRLIKFLEIYCIILFKKAPRHGAQRENVQKTPWNQCSGWRRRLSFLARDSMLSALYAIARPSVRLSVCLSVRPSHGWIRRKRLNLGSCNFCHTVAPSLCFLRYVSSRNSDGIPPSGGVKQWWVAALRETIYFRSSNAFARWLHKLDILSQLLQTYSPDGGTVAR